MFCQLGRVMVSLPIKNMEQSDVSGGSMSWGCAIIQPQLRLRIGCTRCTPIMASEKWEHDSNPLDFSTPLFSVLVMFPMSRKSGSEQCRLSATVFFNFCSPIFRGTQMFQLMCSLFQPRNWGAGWLRWYEVGPVVLGEFRWGLVTDHICFAGWLVVYGGEWLPSIFYFPRNMKGMSSSPLTDHMFQRGGEKPPTRSCFAGRSSRFNINSTWPKTMTDSLQMESTYFCFDVPCPIGWMSPLMASQDPNLVVHTISKSYRINMFFLGKSNKSRHDRVQKPIIQPQTAALGPLGPLGPGVSVEAPDRSKQLGAVARKKTWSWQNGDDDKLYPSGNRWYWKKNYRFWHA